MLQKQLSPVIRKINACPFALPHSMIQDQNKRIIICANTNHIYLARVIKKSVTSAIFLKEHKVKERSFILTPPFTFLQVYMADKFCSNNQLLNGLKRKVT